MDTRSASQIQAMSQNSQLENALKSLLSGFRMNESIAAPMKVLKTMAP